MDTSSDNIEKLYKNYEILSDAKENIGEYENEYKEILVAVKGSAKEKRLASQFIGKFFKYFPNLSETAIDAQLDLCEDEDIQIRRQAIKDLPQICRENKEHTPKIGDILAQLLVTEDTAEFLQVNMSLQTLLKYDAKGTLTGIFSQIASGDEPTREKCFKFLINKIKTAGNEIITKEVEESLIAEVKKILQDVTAEEFHLCMSILSSTKLGTNVSGHGEIVSLAIEQADLGADIDAITIEDEVIERYIQCANHALPYFSSLIESTPFIIFMCDKLLPIHTWNMITAAEQQDQMQLRLLKVFAEMCTYCGNLENASDRVEAIFNILLEFMPLPPLDADILNDIPSFKFSHAECLLYSLHCLAKQSPDFLTFPNDPNKLKDFRSRLQYLARGTQGYIKKLQEAVKGKTPDELKSEDNQIKVTALKTTSNINLLIRDLFHTPPSFKTLIQLSWVNRRPENKGNISNKRHAQITFGGSGGGNIAENGKTEDTRGSKISRSSSEHTTQRVYTPPSGKYSAKVQTYKNGSGGSTGGNGGYNNRQSGRSGRFGNGGGSFRGQKNRNFKRY